MWRNLMPAAMLLCLTACGGSGSGSNANTSNDPAGAPVSNNSSSSAGAASASAGATNNSNAASSGTTSSAASAPTSSPASSSSTSTPTGGGTASSAANTPASSASSSNSTSTSASSAPSGTGSTASTSTSTPATSSTSSSPSSSASSSGSTSGSSSSSSPASSSKVGLLVPAYFDPTADQADWNTLISTAGQVPLIAVMNPADGPGTAQNSSYVTNINAVNSTANGKVIGYIHTSYGARALADVEADVANYAAWYNVKGIFIDEMAASATSANLSYYEQLASFIRSKIPSATIVANPGGAFDQAFATNQTADIFIDEEDVSSNVHNATQASWENSFPASMFAQISIQASSDPTETAWLVANRRIGWLYTTTLALTPNPYANLPSDFTSSISSL